MNKVSQWIKNYAQGKTLIIGVSGGIDSAVTSTLCAETYLPVIAVNIGIYSDIENQRLANAHINWLKDKYSNVKSEEVELGRVFGAFRSTLKIHSDHADANAKSRLRMVYLYYLAAVNNGLVVGTGNKVEDFGVGFFTKYGDGGVDISPIANFYKSEVRQIAKKLSILDEIINAKPTDGLWEDNRTDEDQLGVSYEELEAVMKGQEVSETAKKVYEKFHSQNKHKMEPIPVYKGEF